jgi:hypothetical protein
MVGILYEEKTQEPYLVNTNRSHMKSLTIFPFSLEIERNIAVSCLLASEDKFQTQTSENRISFVTRMELIGM